MLVLKSAQWLMLKQSKLRLNSYIRKGDLEVLQHVVESIYEISLITWKS